MERAVFFLPGTFLANFFRTPGMPAPSYLKHNQYTSQLSKTQVASYLFRLANTPKRGYGVCVINGYISEGVILQRQFWLTYLSKCLIRRYFSCNARTFILYGTPQIILKDIGILPQMHMSQHFCGVKPCFSNKLIFYIKSNYSSWEGCSQQHLVYRYFVLKFLHYWFYSHVL